MKKSLERPLWQNDHTWRDCRKILCVRPDNMGDVLMSAPAISALKESFRCSITLLTSSMGAGISPYLPTIDEVIVWDVPWVKGTEPSNAKEFEEILLILKSRKFDAAVIFTVFSQNPLATALMLTLAGIPRRLAYCRENPYHLLSHWIPEQEPYTFVRHQVQRDLDLVGAIGATAQDDKITIKQPDPDERALREKLVTAGVNPAKPWLIMHPGVSERKREFPADRWVLVGKKLTENLDHQVLLTGGNDERTLTDSIAAAVGQKAFSLGGYFSLGEFISLIRFSPLLISVNTASIHLAAALQTKMIVLYAMTNPQHTPWRGIGKVFPFSIPEDLQSKNEVLRFVKQSYFSKKIEQVDPEDIFQAAVDLLTGSNEPIIEELISSPPGKIKSGDQQEVVIRVAG